MNGLGSLLLSNIPVLIMMLVTVANVIDVG